MSERLKVVAFDLDEASLTSLRAALPSWEIEVLLGATGDTIPHEWNPGEVDLLVVHAGEDEATKLALCRVLMRRGVFSRIAGKEVPVILGPRGSLESQAQRAHAPLLVLVPPGKQELVNAALEAGAHSCLVLPINSKEVVSMLIRARGGNQPGRHTANREKAQGEDQWRDEGGQG
jgi:hypothetical protein